MSSPVTAARQLRAYFAGLLTLVVADYFWLGTLMVGFYREHLGELLLPLPRMGAAVLFYLMYIAGLQFFVLRHLFARGGYATVALQSALFGVLAYGTYDLSNLATLRIWQVDLTVADMSWGALITAVSGTVAVRVARFGAERPAA